MLSKALIPYKLNRWIKLLDNCHLISKLNIIHGGGLKQIIGQHCRLNPNLTLNSLKISYCKDLFDSILDKSIINFLQLIAYIS